MKHRRTPAVTGAVRSLRHEDAAQARYFSGRVVVRFDAHVSSRVETNFDPAAHSRPIRCILLPVIDPATRAAAALRR
jgi:hypothetical protein